MSHSYSCVLVHAIFGTKGREPWIQREIEGELHAYSIVLLRNLGCPCLALQAMPEHLHALFSLSRTASIADVIEELKKRTSKWIKSKGPSYSRFAWQSGYGAFSVSQSNADAVRSYIANQQLHHQARSFEEEYRLFLARHGIEFRENDLWNDVKPQPSPARGGMP